MEEKVYKQQIIKLAMAKRVVDEEQVQRHYIETDVHRMYKFDDKPNDFDLDLDSQMPDDDLIAMVIRKHHTYITSFENHDALLENQTQEVLSKDEVDAAWKEFKENRQKAEMYSVEHLTGNEFEF